MKTFLARAEIMFVLLAIIVFVCWQQHQIAQREEEAFLRAVEATRKEEAALREQEERWQAELTAKAKAAEPLSERIAPPPHEAKQPQR
ncbi:MAG: hypothetical protein U0792_16285 [Gemmataceae bacterium]